jgi:hypothetical protein
MIDSLGYSSLYLWKEIEEFLGSLCTFAIFLVLTVELVGYVALEYIACGANL